MSDEAAAVAGRAADAVQAEKVEQLGSPRTDETTTEIMGLEKKLKPTPPSNQQPPEPPEPETKVVCPLNKRGWTHTCDAQLQSDPTGQFQEEMTLCASPGCQRVGRCTGAEIRSGVTHLKKKSGAIGRFAAGSALADRFGFLVVGGGTKTKKVDVEEGGSEDDRDKPRPVELRIAAINDEKLYKWAEASKDPDRPGQPPSAEGPLTRGGAPSSSKTTSSTFEPFGADQVKEKLEKLADDDVVELCANLHRVKAFDVHDAMLLLACRSVRNLGLVEALLDNKLANPACQDRFGHACVHRAVAHCNRERNAEELCFLETFEEMQAAFHRAVEGEGRRGEGEEQWEEVAAYESIADADADQPPGAAGGDGSGAGEEKALVLGREEDEVEVTQGGEAPVGAQADATEREQGKQAPIAGAEGAAEASDAAEEGRGSARRTNSTVGDRRRRALAWKAACSRREQRALQAAGESAGTADAEQVPQFQAISNGGSEGGDTSGGAVKRWTFLDVVRLLLRAGALPDHPVSAPLLDCRSVRALKLLCDAKANLLAQHSDDEIMRGDSALHTFAARNERAMVRLLLSEAKKRTKKSRGTSARRAVGGDEIENIEDGGLSPEEASDGGGAVDDGIGFEADPLYLRKLVGLKDQFGHSALSSCTDEYVGMMLVQAGCEVVEDWVMPLNKEPGFEDWVMPLSKDADKGHNCERVRIEARKKFRYITDREYEYQLKMWRRENPEWRKWKL